MGDGEGGGAAATVTALQDTIKWVGQIIADGRPNASLPGQMANAVPANQDWASLTGAQGPNILSFGLQIPGVFYGTNVNVQMKLKWDFGARYHGGGAFITNAWLEVPTCDVEWGFKVNLSFAARNPENSSGSETAPVARLPITITGNTETALRNQTVQWGFMLYGDGRWEQS